MVWTKEKGGKKGKRGERRVGWSERLMQGAVVVGLKEEEEWSSQSTQAPGLENQDIQKKQDIARISPSPIPT